MPVSTEQQAQFSYFMACSRRSGRAVLSILDDVVLLNQRARQLSHANQLALHAAVLQCDTWDHEGIRDFTLRTGTNVVARAYTSADGVPFPGVVLEILASDPPSVAVQGPLGSLVGESPAWRKLVGEAIRAAGARLPVLLFGEPGTGKLAVAEALVTASSSHRLVVMDVASVRRDAHSLVGHLRVALRSRSTAVILQHLEHSESVAPVLLTELEHSASHAWVLGTINHHALHLGGRPLLDRFWPVHVPPLRDRRDDIPMLLTHFVTRHSATIQFQAEALQRLQARRYPDNVRQLERLIEHLIRRGCNGKLGPDDLPGRIEHGRSHT